MASVKSKFRVEWGIALLILCNFLACSCRAQDQEYEIPQPKFKLLKPKGFQVSIPDEHGIQLFAFHGNLNRKMEKMGSGDFSIDIIDKMNGKWIYQNPKLKVTAGDVIYFWVFVIKSGVGYKLENGIYEVTENEVNRVSKKIHNLRKRFVHQEVTSAHDTYGRRFNPYKNEFRDGRLHPLSTLDEIPFGLNAGDRFPSHDLIPFHRNFGSIPYGYSRFHSNYKGIHGPSDYHGSHHGHGFHHHHGHHEHNAGCDHHHHHHNWDSPKHNNFDWDDSSDNSDETSSAENIDVSTSNNLTPVITSAPVTTPTTRKPTTLPTIVEPDVEMIETTTAPQIDIRFGMKNK